MELSLQNKGTLFCSIRKEEVKNSPEECVRQDILLKMVALWGFPKELIIVEKKLSQLPIYYNHKVADRRIDILAFGANGKAIFPLLLIECKKSKISSQAIHQTLGYNYAINAPFIALASREQFSLFHVREGKFFPFDEEPLYINLIKKT